MVAGFVFLAVSCLHAQEGYHFRDGKKYPDSKVIDVRKPVGPSTLRLKSPLDNEDRSFGDGVSRPTVHIDRMTSYTNDPLSANTRKSYTYSSNADLTELLSEYYNGSEWVPYERSTYTYDAKGHVLTETVSWPEEPGWFDFLFLTYTYNNAGLCISLLYEDVFGFTELVTISYDHQRNKIKEFGQVLDPILNEYVNFELWTYTYNNQGDMLTMTGQLWDEGSWWNYVRETWTYQSKGKWLTDMIEDSDGVSWFKYSLFENQYNAKGYVGSYTGNYWINGTTGWLPIVGGRFSYDKSGNLVTNISMYNDSQLYPPDWVDTDKTETNFDYNGMSITATGYVRADDEWVRGETNIYVPFNDHGNILVFADEYPSNLVEVKYSRAVPGNGLGDGRSDGPLEVNENGAPGAVSLSVTVDPNPVKDRFRVVVIVPVDGAYTFSLVNGQGVGIQQIFNGNLAAGRNEISLNAPENLPRGLFFLHVTSPGFSATVKLIRE